MWQRDNQARLRPPGPLQSLRIGISTTVAGYRIAVVEMPILFEIEVDLAAGVELDCHVATFVNALEDPQIAVGDLKGSVGRGKLHAVTIAERSIVFPVHGHAL